MTEEQFFKIIGDKIRTVRRYRGMMQEELCLKAGVSRPLLSNIENGKANPTASILCKLIEALDCDLLFNLKLRELT